ncbi:MAG: phenylacetate--CoA ligase family protein [Proteobacteria bacterium]|nr:phenylacetate--CoA ligase family protein [Pseudomonadota bacterium]
MGIGKVFRIGKAVFDGYRLSKNVCKSSKYIEKLQNKRLSKAVATAYYETDFYREKYDSHGVKPRDIQGIEDLSKLPIVTKQELMDNFETAIPKSLNRERAIAIGTSGSTGQPLQVYKDQMWLAHCFGFAFLMRRIHKMGLPRVGFIFDVGSSGSIEQHIQDNSVWYAKYFAPRTLILPVDLDIVEIMEKLEEAKVQYLCTYTGIARELATLRKNGMGKNLKIKKVGLTGEILDDYTRQHIESAFECTCYTSYASTEAGPIALECENKNMHVYSDTCIVEVTDEQGNAMPKGEDGRIVLTCPVMGLSTPVIRYNGCSDAGRILPGKCNCGVNTPIMGPIQGRLTDSIHLPNGKIYHAFSMTIPMEKILRDHSRDRIRQYQIVQGKVDEITISLLRNKAKTEPDDSLSDIMKIIKKKYQEQLGSEVHLTLNEVEEIPKGNNMAMPTPLVLSKIDKNNKM